MSAGEDGILGRLPRERPGTRSAKRTGPAAAARPGESGPAAAGTDEPPRASGDPVREALRAAGTLAESGARTAARLAGGLLGRLPRP